MLIKALWEKWYHLNLLSHHGNHLKRLLRFWNMITYIDERKNNKNNGREGIKSLKYGNREDTHIKPLFSSFIRRKGQSGKKELPIMFHIRDLLFQPSLAANSAHSEPSSLSPLSSSASPFSTSSADSSSSESATFLGLPRPLPVADSDDEYGYRRFKRETADLEWI